MFYAGYPLFLLCLEGVTFLMAVLFYAEKKLSVSHVNNQINVPE